MGGGGGGRGGEGGGESQGIADFVRYSNNHMTAGQGDLMHNSNAAAFKLKVVLLLLFFFSSATVQ